LKAKINSDITSSRDYQLPVKHPLNQAHTLHSVSNSVTIQNDFSIVLEDEDYMDADDDEDQVRSEAARKEVASLSESGF
jgi:hypothetical protein